MGHKSEKWQWRHSSTTWRHCHFFKHYFVSLVKFSYWFKFHVNIITGFGVMTIYFYNGFFFAIYVFFRKHSRFTGQQGKGEAISLSPLYQLHPLHRHLNISWAITAESSPLNIASSRTRTGNLWFPSASHYPLSYAPLKGVIRDWREIRISEYPRLSFAQYLDTGTS